MCVCLLICYIKEVIGECNLFLVDVARQYFGDPTFTGPDGRNAYQFISPSTNRPGANVASLSGDSFASSFAYQSRLSGNYSGHVLQWSSPSASIFNLEINEDSTSTRRLLAIRFRDHPPVNYLLPSPGGFYQTVGFSLRNGTVLSAYADCYFLGAIDMVKRVGATGSARLDFFRSVTQSNPALVRTLESISSVLLLLLPIDVFSQFF